MKLPFYERYLDSNGISLSFPKMEILEWLDQHTDIDQVTVTVIYQIPGPRFSTRPLQTKTFPITELNTSFMTLFEMTIELPDDMAAFLFKLTW